jgi:glycosyltransferase involved in cell wall biosynthesis
MPTFNRCFFLREAVLSVYEQSYRPIECIVVDDGSTDDTDSLINELKKLNSDEFELIYIKQANAGAQVARNNGTAAAKGVFFQYLDSDDLLYPEKIAKQVKFLEQHPKCDCVFGDWDSGNLEDRIFVKAYKCEDFIFQIISNERPLHTLSFLMRKSLVEKTGNWDPSIKRMQEIDFQLTAVMAGGNFCYQEQCCGLWRYHNEARIHNQTKPSDMIPFYRKWEIHLKEKKWFSHTIAHKIADLYLWQVTSNPNHAIRYIIPVLQEVIRLNPSIPFYQSRILRFLQTIAGLRIALFIWMLFFRLRNS